MWRTAMRRLMPKGLPVGAEYVPGLGVVAHLADVERWRLAGEYATKHRRVGPWYWRVCAACGTRSGCQYGRWAQAVLGKRR
jgi:hypothetical protein